MTKITFRRKLRFLQRSNRTGNVIGITLPRNAVFENKKLSDFIGVKFKVDVVGSTIVLSSGGDISQMEDIEIKNVLVEEKRFRI